MIEVQIPPTVAALLVLNGHAQCVTDDVLELTPSGVKWLEDWLLNEWKECGEEVA